MVLFTFPNDWMRGLSFTMCGANKVATVVVVLLLTLFFWSSWILCTLDANGVDNKYASVKGRHIITDGPPCKSKLFADSFVYVQCRYPTNSPTGGGGGGGDGGVDVDATDGATILVPAGTLASWTEEEDAGRSGRMVLGSTENVCMVRFALVSS